VLLTHPAYADGPKDDDLIPKASRDLTTEDAHDWAEKLQRFLEAHPDRADLRTHYGLVLKQLERHSEAAEQLKIAVRLQPKDAYARALLGQILVTKLGRVEEGIGYLRQAFAQAPKLGDVAYDLAMALMRLEQPPLDEAQRAFGVAVQADPDRLQYLWDEVEEAKTFNRLDLARQKAVTLALLDPDSAMSWQRAAKVCLEYEKGSTTGITLMQRSFDLRLGNPDDSVDPPIFLLSERLVEELLQAKRPKDAEDVARRLVGSRPTNDIANVLLINVYQQMGQVDQAEAAARQWAKRQPESGAPFKALADLYVARGQWPQAKVAFDESIKRSPGEPGVHLAYAIAAQTKQDWSSAATQFRQYLRLRPYESDAHIGLATCLINLGPQGRQEAKAILKKRAAIEPDNKAVHSLLKSLH
jgi:tetratricopeptide (TPR) repeat protein